MTIVHGGEKAYMLGRVNDFSHVNKLGIVGLEYDAGLAQRIWGP